MDAFIDFFSHITTFQKMAWVLGCLLVAWGLEALVPLVQLNYKKWRHVATNLVFFSFTAILNIGIGLLFVGLFLWIETDQVGILGLLALPVWAEFLIGVMALDLFAQYISHYLLHRVKWMWKFHMVHHSDTKVDATTGTRHHPGDYVIREVFAALAIVIFGIPVAYYAFYRIATVFFTYVTHANFVLPGWLDRVLSLVFITPNMHKFHHHFERPWTDTNFGNIFSIWDRMFGTFVYDDPRKVEYGLDVTDGSRDLDIRYQLGLPLNKNIKTDY
jgi:sterol desaturase/sphingolipid hydroxylase (fatty acid hydroxylase superfamily)